MDAEKFKVAQQEYERGDFRAAARGFLEASEQGTPVSNGASYHMAGNSFMRLKRYNDAITVYEHALRDDTYLRRAAVELNLANAYLKAGEFDAAIAHYQAAIEEPDCKSPYKCYQGLGTALMEKEVFDQAAIAYRRAAVDQANPNPGASLINLGLCLMTIDRPQDAAEAYKAALGAESYKNKGLALSNLGMAYAKAGEWQRAVRAFEEAMTLHNHRLSATAKEMLEYAYAQTADRIEDELDAQIAEENHVVDNSLVSSNSAFEEDFTDEMLPVASAPESVASTSDISVLAADLAGRETNAFQRVDTVQALTDPISIDSGVIDEGAMDSMEPLNIGNQEDVELFFGRSEGEAVKIGKELERAGRSRFRWVKWVVTVIIILALIGGGAAAVYFTGFGVPSGREIVGNALDAYNSGKAFDGYWIDSTNTVREMAAVPVPATYTIESVAVSGFSAVASVAIKPQSGAAIAFKFNIVRSGVGWKIKSVENDF